MVYHFIIALFGFSCLLNSITLMTLRKMHERMWLDIEALFENAKFINDEQRNNLERFSGVYGLIGTLAGIDMDKDDESNHEQGQI